MDIDLFNRLRVNDNICKKNSLVFFTVIDSFGSGASIEVVRHKKITDTTLDKWCTPDEKPLVTREAIQRGNILKHKSSGLEYIVELVALDHVSCVHMRQIDDKDAGEWYLYSPKIDDY